MRGGCCELRSRQKAWCCDGELRWHSDQQNDRGGADAVATHWRAPLTRLVRTVGLLAVGTTIGMRIEDGRHGRDRDRRDSAQPKREGDDENDMRVPTEHGEACNSKAPSLREQAARWKCLTLLDQHGALCVTVACIALAMMCLALVLVNHVAPSTQRRSQRVPASILRSFRLRRSSELSQDARRAKIRLDGRFLRR